MNYQTITRLLNSPERREGKNVANLIHAAQQEVTKVEKKKRKKVKL